MAPNCDFGDRIRNPAIAATRRRAPSTAGKRLVSAAEGPSRGAARRTAARETRVGEAMRRRRSGEEGRAPCRRGRWPRFLFLADAPSERVYKSGKRQEPLSRRERGRGEGDAAVRRAFGATPHPALRPPSPEREKGRAPAEGTVDLVEASCFRSRRAVKERSPPAAARETRVLDRPSASEVFAFMRSTARWVGRIAAPAHNIDWIAND